MPELAKKRQRPDKVELFLLFQMSLVWGFVGLLAWGAGEWIGIW